jgi:hypothetical protein
VVFVRPGGLPAPLRAPPHPLFLSLFLDDSYLEGAEVDYGSIVKTFSHSDLEEQRRYSPPDVMNENAFR